MSSKVQTVRLLSGPCICSYQPLQPFLWGQKLYSAVQPHRTSEYHIFICGLQHAITCAWNSCHTSSSIPLSSGQFFIHCSGLNFNVIFFFFFVFQPKFHFIKANLNLCLSNTLTKTYPLVEIEYNFCNPWAWLFFILYRKYRTIWRPSNFLFSYTPSALELYVFFIMSFVWYSIVSVYSIFLMNSYGMGEAGENMRLFWWISTCPLDLCHHPLLQLTWGCVNLCGNRPSLMTTESKGSDWL